jgi:hypothetical protein
MIFVKTQTQQNQLILLTTKQNNYVIDNPTLSIIN